MRVTHKRGLLTGILVCLSWSCCTPLLEIDEPGELFGLAGADLTPPVMTASAAADSRSFVMEFNETIESVRLEGVVPTLAEATAEIDGNLVRVTSADAQEPGKEYTLDVLVTDTAGNSLQLLVRCFGHNPRVPDLLINEFTTQGSSTHPDIVEVLVLSAGNLAGACLYEGTPEDWANRMIFPSCEVEAGEFLVVHFKPQGIDEEIDEIDGTDVSGGLDASPEGRDFWVPDGSGISGYNGVLALYTDPFGEILDAVVYSNRTSASDDRYRGFGSTRVMERVDTIAEAGAWIGEQLPLRPEDAIDPDDSTATRSNCRGSDSADTDTKHDWHIVPTSTYSFGRVNSDEVYVP